MSIAHIIVLDEMETSVSENSHRMAKHWTIRWEASTPYRLCPRSILGFIRINAVGWSIPSF